MDAQQVQNASSLIAGMAGVFMIIGLALFAFVIFLFWRIFSKAGMSGSMAFLLLIPGVGGLIALCILAFSDWRTPPVAFPGPPVYPTIG